MRRFSGSGARRNLYLCSRPTPSTGSGSTSAAAFCLSVTEAFSDLFYHCFFSSCALIKLPFSMLIFSCEDQDPMICGLSDPDPVLFSPDQTCDVNIGDKK